MVMIAHHKLWGTLSNSVFESSLSMKNKTIENMKAWNTTIAVSKPSSRVLAFRVFVKTCITKLNVNKWNKRIDLRKINISNGWIAFGAWCILVWTIRTHTEVKSNQCIIFLKYSTRDGANSSLSTRSSRNHVTVNIRMLERILIRWESSWNDRNVVKENWIIVMRNVVRFKMETIWNKEKMF